MQAVVATNITITASLAAVFRYLTDLKYHYLWNPQVRNISATGQLKLGSRYKTESVVLGITIKATNVVTDFKPLKELVIENSLGPVQYSARFRLSPQSNQTRVQLQVTLSTDAVTYIFTGPVLKQLALRELRTDLQALKIAVENKLQ